jgi:hypothetical protein
MSKFLVTYHGGGMPSDPAQAAQAKAAFGAWLADAGKAVVDPGAPVQMVAQVSQGASSEKVAIGGYTVIEAPTQEDAIRLLKKHPFVARGGTLQLNQVMAV